MTDARDLRAATQDRRQAPRRVEDARLNLAEQAIIAAAIAIVDAPDDGMLESAHRVASLFDAVALYRDAVASHPTLTPDKTGD
jgi:hypothetical protein